MITYTGAMGTCAGVGLLLLVGLGYRLVWRPGPLPGWEGWALSLGSLGAISTALGLHMTLTWPLTLEGEVYKNFVFGEPILILGVLLLAAARWVWRRGPELAEGVDGLVDVVYAACRPVAVIILVQGAVLASNLVGAVNYKIFSTAPVQEPIFGTWPEPVVSIGLYAIVLALPALGALLLPVGVWLRSRPVLATAGAAWVAAGVGLTLAGVVVYGAHIAMDFNFRS
ncbi:DUF981 family protein [Polymorphospora sp. NPDC050346]|uniref:DUF981 family protein n=1 Tax=Polymorphospora sp. NPDC050346 TaxID=3155780 RepID=UPI0033DE7C05